MLFVPVFYASSVGYYIFLKCSFYETVSKNGKNSLFLKEKRVIFYFSAFKVYVFSQLLSTSTDLKPAFLSASLSWATVSGVS